MKYTPIFAAIIVIKSAKSEDVTTFSDLFTVNSTDLIIQESIITSTISYRDQESANTYPSKDNEIITFTEIAEERTTKYDENVPTLFGSNEFLLENNKAVNILPIEIENRIIPVNTHPIIETTARPIGTNENLKITARFTPEPTSTVLKKLVHKNKYSNNIISVYPTKLSLSSLLLTNANDKSFKTLDEFNTVADISVATVTKIIANSAPPMRSPRYLPIFSTRQPLLTPNKSLYPAITPKLNPQPSGQSTRQLAMQEYFPYSSITTSSITKPKLKAEQLKSFHDFEDNYDLDGFDNNIEIEDQESSHNLKITKNIDRLSNNYRPYIKENNTRKYSVKDVNYFEKINYLPTSPPASEIFAKALEWLWSKDLIRLR